ncbi:putative alpha-N-arabinofuranosidase C [Glarea lozoyensis 74030]|uniref:non-reducing end alpha-L-arabinofuranosidase n=1 Tax=Glarea lozoyensis (strain ATCC 74030 / MF5533) TaxID=1104152 RepID=H0ETJ0_GLAL7|nr:putative alpha-N-arabinofuranosidase C [Glarea lozoyensis 74030]
MTTFTRIEENATPSMNVDISKRLSKINDNIYGGFTEHMGRCIYGGIYEPGNPLSDEHGYRTDVLSALRELDIPVIRYPGGNFVATYHWQDGVGPKENRPSRPELAWGAVETNEFGTMEEALAWVEYCNGTKDTYYANLRRKNGHPEPYNVKYWALGNEMWGPWQVGQMTANEYAHKATQWAKALKLLDPSLCLILCGQEGLSTWDWTVLSQCIKFVDMHSIHIGTCGIRSELLVKKEAKNLTPYPMPWTVNVISPLMTTKDGIMKQTTWWPLLLYSKYMRGYTIGVHVRGGAYDGETYPPWLQGTLAEGASWLDISACISESGTVTLAVVNVSETKDFETDMQGIGSDIEVFTVTGDNVKVVNTEGNEKAEDGSSAVRRCPVRLAGHRC